MENRNGPWDEFKKNKNSNIQLLHTMMGVLIVYTYILRKSDESDILVECKNYIN